VVRERADQVSAAEDEQASSVNMFQTITLRIIALLSVFCFVVTGRVAPRLRYSRDASPNVG